MPLSSSISLPTKLGLTALVVVSCWVVPLLMAPSNVTENQPVSCLQRLRIPIYPPLAASARVGGSVSAKFLIPVHNASQQSKMDVQFTSVSPHAELFEAAIQEALRKSSFSGACSGKTLDLTFHFELSDDAKNSVSFGYPLQFWISTKAPHWQP